MNNIFRILLLGALPLAAFPVIQASAQEPDIQTLLSAERSSFISGKARDILCRKLGTANLDTDKIRAMAHAPQVALLCHLYQFFSAAENGEPFTQHELKDESFRKWLSTHPEVFRMLALSGAAGKQTLSIFYRIWNANNKTLRPVETSMALGAGLASNVILLKNACPNSIFTGNPTSNPHAIPRRTRCSRGNGPSFSVAERAWKTCPGPSSS